MVATTGEPTVIVIASVVVAAPSLTVRRAV